MLRSDETRARKFMRARPRDPKFGCVFDPNEYNFLGYVEHISKCSHEDCQRRYQNHLATKRELLNHQHCAIISGNEDSPADPEARFEDPADHRPGIR